MIKKIIKKILVIFPVMLLFGCGYCVNCGNKEAGKPLIKEISPVPVETRIVETNPENQTPAQENPASTKPQKFPSLGQNEIDTASKTNPAILTLFSSNTSAENKVWIGTFQLVFNDMKNNIIKHKIEFIGEKPTKELTALNNEEFNSSMLNPETYYTSYGETSPEARDKIKSDLKKKFNTKSDLIDTLDWKKSIGRFYAYAMLKKEFDFLREFDELDKKSFNDSKNKYKFFGIKDESDDKLDKNLGVLFYNNPDDYAVQLYTKNNDIVYLYRSESNDNFKKLFNEMKKKKEQFKGETKFQEIDTLMIPEIKFNQQRDYKELCNKLIKDEREIYFSNAIETIEFSLDKKGGKVKSEAALMLETCALEAYDPNQKPRHFNFDKTFILFLIDKDKQDPYMALRIKNLEGLQE